MAGRRSQGLAGHLALFGMAGLYLFILCCGLVVHVEVCKGGGAVAVVAEVLAEGGQRGRGQGD